MPEAGKAVAEAANSVPEDRGAVLVAIAREAIGERLARGTLRRREDAWLSRLAATFVTLRCEGELRGCIGSIDPRRPLAEDVAANALAAAFSDPRFAPLSIAEYEATSVEVSVLSPRVPLPAASEAEAIRALCPGRDGLCLEYRERRATFLPQVWESIPEPARFLAALRHKASLPGDFWDPAIRLSRYTVDKYGDGPPPR